MFGLDWDGLLDTVIHHVTGQKITKAYRSWFVHQEDEEQNPVAGTEKERGQQPFFNGRPPDLARPSTLDSIYREQTENRDCLLCLFSFKFYC